MTDRTYDAVLCDERHKRIEDDMKTLFKKLDLWSLVIVLLTIATLVSNFIFIGK